MTVFEQIIAGMVVALFVAFLGAIGLVYSRMRTMELKMVELGTQVSPLWAQVQARIAKELHHPHLRYKEMDKLLEKLEAKPLTLADGERTRLKELLSIRAVDTHPDITPQQRSSAALMLGVMDKVLEETALAGDNPIPVPDSPPFPDKKEK
jgi:hypothetical protein